MKHFKTDAAARRALNKWRNVDRRWRSFTIVETQHANDNGARLYVVTLKSGSWAESTSGRQGSMRKAVARALRSWGCP